MSGFIDEYPPDAIYRYNFRSVPRFSTDITVAASGSERRNQNWSYPLRRLVAPGVIDCETKLEPIYNMFMALAGPAYSFPIRDPMDFASRPVTRALQPPVIGATDQVIGTGDGVTTEFQLQKVYTFGSRTLTRPIHKPVVSSVLLALNGDSLASASGGPYSASIDRDTGVVTITPAPNNLMVVTAGFYFDCEVRFEADDSFERMTKAVGAGQVADLVFIEIPPCGS